MFEIYTNYEGRYPTELEETVNTWAEVLEWAEEFEQNATEEESFVVKQNGEVVLMA